MEGIQSIRGKQESKQELILNHFNGLFKDNEVVTQNLVAGIKELKDKDSQKIRREQLDIYRDFVKKILGHNIDKNPEQDPFFKVTQVPIEKVYLEKHDIVNKDKIGTNKLLLSSTMILSGNYFYELTNLRTLLASEDIKVTFELLDPNLINNEKDWIMHFGFLNFTSSAENLERMISEALIILEPEVVDALREVMSNQEMLDLEKKLKEIKTWFNHDLTAHGTYLPRNNDVDQQIIASHKNNYNEIFKSEFLVDSYESAFTGELWSLNLHQSIFQEFVKDRPAIFKFLAKHLSQYISTVDQIIEKIPENKPRNDYKDYLLKVYAFCFFRLINPEIYANDPMFKDIFDQYPNLANLGNNEEKIREYIYTQPGMYDSKKGNYIHHKKIFKEFTDSFQALEEIKPIEEKIKKHIILKTEKTDITEDEIEKYANYLINKREVRNFFKSYVPRSEFIKTKNEVSLSDLMQDNHNIKKLLSLLVSHPDQVDNLLAKAIKVCFGFKNPQTGKRVFLSKDTK